jgi:hypothetical protein
VGGERLERLRALEDLLADPLGNHLVMVRGHHAAALRRWHGAMIG